MNKHGSGVSPKPRVTVLVLLKETADHKMDEHREAVTKIWLKQGLFQDKPRLEEG